MVGCGFGFGLGVCGWFSVMVVGLVILGTFVVLYFSGYVGWGFGFGFWFWVVLIWVVFCV